ncbi:IS91 family transposase [Propionivibrio sp.]|uniref:IS91 family transposase n=1 Tax=Propionivibrio sp. TaxID=2212460 RepID=UPI003BF3C57E
MRATGLEVADIFRQAGPRYREQHATALSCGQRGVMSAIERCRTAALGGHVEQCDACGHQRIAFNSCRNRHCPKCQSLVRAQWLEDRQADLLPVEYFHVVFTLPEVVAAIAYQNKAVVYDLLFRATAETLRTIAADPKHLGAEIGFIAILHTWGQNLLHHPHLHCLVPGGGLSADGERWISCRPGFFLPVRVLSRLFRRLFLEQFQRAFDAGDLHFYHALEELQAPAAFARYLAPVRKTEWVVYAKPPFGGPRQVLEYLGRYTHRVAISNNRLINFADDQVRFRWKDYRHESRPKVMQLAADEFIRRFLLHVLPSGFQRIRHYGFLANRYRAVKLERCRQLLAEPAPIIPVPDAPLDYRDRYQLLTGKSLRDCPKCGQGHMVCIETFLPGTLPRGPPEKR